MLAAAIKRLRERFYKPELDAGRVRRVYREYDIGRRYGEYHAYCQTRLVRELDPAPHTSLQQRGFEYFTPLDENDAAKWRRDLRKNYSSGLLKKDSKHLEGFRVDDMTRLQELLAIVLAGPLDQRIVEYFRSEYLLHWVTFSVTRKAKEQASVSFRWHCDKGPSSHLKLIVYLNPTEAHGGNTEFIDLAGTAAVARNGYLFGWSKSRSSDIRHLSRLAGRDLVSHASPLRAGQAVLFQPSRVLHRGLSPDRGDRLVMTLCILPSPVHWKIALQSGALFDLAVDEKWHKDAMGILDRINI
ncbi:MAG: hypothetical protein WBS20_14615 [Lysobacterales bacterium]